MILQLHLKTKRDGSKCKLLKPTLQHDLIYFYFNNINTWKVNRLFWKLRLCFWWEALATDNVFSSTVPRLQLGPGRMYLAIGWHCRQRSAQTHFLLLFPVVVINSGFFTAKIRQAPWHQVTEACSLYTIALKCSSHALKGFGTDSSNENLAKMFNFCRYKRSVGNRTIIKRTPESH